MESNIGKKVIIRGNRSGVEFGTLVAQNGSEVTLKNARRIWYWSGAASLSQLAKDGTSNPASCKFTVTNLGKNGKVYMANNSPLLANDGYDYISISVRKGTKVHNILEKEMPLKGVERSYGAEVCYRVPKSEFEKEEL